LEFSFQAASPETFGYTHVDLYKMNIALFCINGYNCVRKTNVCHYSAGCFTVVAPRWEKDKQQHHSL